MLLGPWAARWPVAAVCMAAAGVFGALALRGPRDGALAAIALGFASLALATGLRALGGHPPALLWLLYLLAAAGLVTAIEVGARPAAVPEEAREG